jgi:hypothetical protein
MKSNIIKTTIAITAVAVLSIGAQSALAASNTDKPGWGNGDKNHVHVGPPGQSVRPDVQEKVQKKLDKVADKLEKIDEKVGENNPSLSQQLQDLINRLRHFFD